MFSGVVDVNSARLVTAADKFQPCNKATALSADRGLQGTAPCPHSTITLTTSLPRKCPEFGHLGRFIAMLFSSIIPSLAAATVVVLATPIAASEYHEQLTLRPLQPSSLLASFDFRANTSLEAFEQQNFRYFPRSLGQILQAANTKELHLRFSLGRWDAESWGARPWGGRQEGGTGVEIWAWVEADGDEE